MQRFFDCVSNNARMVIASERDEKMRKILITGAAGFIGAFLCKWILESESDTLVIGLDNLNEYYDVDLKRDRLRMIALAAGGRSEDMSSSGFEAGRFVFIKGDIADDKNVNALFEKYQPEIVINLAAQAGVRYSIENPRAYIDSNLVGFFNILEACRDHPVEHLIFASSSSVYGENSKVPFSEADQVDYPVSLYAATKKADELLAFAYSKLYGIPTTGLRFFTVYGPMGRPDMAYFGFAEKLTSGEVIQIFNYGNCKRDFTYIEDIVEGIIRVMDLPFDGGELRQTAYRIYNIGNNSPVDLLEFVGILQRSLIQVGVLPEDYDFEAHQKLVPMQPGDVPVTYADTSRLEQDTGYKPSTSLDEGLLCFAKWYQEYKQMRR